MRHTAVTFPLWLRPIGRVKLIPIDPNDKGLPIKDVPQLWILPGAYALFFTAARTLRRYLISRTQTLRLPAKGLRRVTPKTFFNEASFTLANIAMSHQSSALQATAKTEIANRSNRIRSPDFLAQATNETTPALPKPIRRVDPLGPLP